MFPISIALTQPSGSNLPSYSKLFPTWDILDAYKKRHINWTGYTDRYKAEILNNLNVFEVYKELNDMALGKIPVLICWEGKTKPCHRQIVADWFRINGCLCEEF